MNLMADAVEQGKVRAVGVSNYSADQMRLAHRVLADRGIPLASNQVEYSLLHRQPETDGVLDACRELGVTLIANQPLANGALTGKFVGRRAADRLPSLHAPLPGQGARGRRRPSSPCSARSARPTTGARPRSPCAGSSRTNSSCRSRAPRTAARRPTTPAPSPSRSPPPRSRPSIGRPPPGAARKERRREARTPDLFVHLARRTRGDRPDPRPRRPDRRRGRLRLHLGHGPLLADRRRLARSSSRCSRAGRRSASWPPTASGPGSG